MRRFCELSHVVQNGTALTKDLRYFLTLYDTQHSRATSWIRDELFAFPVSFLYPLDVPDFGPENVEKMS